MDLPTDDLLMAEKSKKIDLRLSKTSYPWLASEIYVWESSELSWSVNKLRST